MSEMIAVYRIADAPQWACDFAVLARDDDPVFIIEPSDGDMAARLTLAAKLVSLYCRHSILRGEQMRPVEGQRGATLVYTVARGTM